MSTFIILLTFTKEPIVLREVQCALKKFKLGQFKGPFLWLMTHFSPFIKGILSIHKGHLKMGPQLSFGCPQK